MAADWAEALAPVDDRIGAMGRFLREEVAAGRGLPARRRPGLPGVRAAAGRRTRAGRRPGPVPDAGPPDRAELRGRRRDVRPIPREPASTSTSSCATTSASCRRTHGDLTAWADQGVMLLNRVLTVRPGESATHRGRGWEEITQCAIRRWRAAAGRAWRSSGAATPQPQADARPDPVGRVRAPVAAVGVPRLLRLPAVQPGQRAARASRAAAPVDWRLPDGIKLNSEPLE